LPHSAPAANDRIVAGVRIESAQGMKTADFIVARRPSLADIRRFPTVEFADYERRLVEQQEMLQRIQQAYLGTLNRAVVVLEGWDTAGKGGIVRRLGWALDPRSFKVHTIAAPTEREKTLHYLQRFWERLPQHGQIVVFDRSWYGRVLVERIEGFATPDEWKRAYDEINDFERMLIADETRLVKLFLHITPEEQIRRFRSRLADPLKRWKLSYEDFRNRTRWKDYEAAIEEMMQKTSTHRAPWHLIPANDKPYGRLAALRIIADRLSKNVALDPRPLDPKVLEAAERLLGIFVPANGPPSKKSARARLNEGGGA
jgi:AMP-polyphosphate phosphotransferase